MNKRASQSSTDGSPLLRMSSWRRAAVLAGALSAVTLVIVLAFSWPASSSRPKNLPIAVAPAAAVVQVTQQLAANGAAGLLEVTGYPDAASAQQAILDRDVVGAIVIRPTGPQVFKAGAASQLVAGVLDQLAATMAAGAPPAKATELAPPGPGDPTGSAFATAVLPLTLSSLALGGGFGMLVRPRAPRAVGVVGAALAMGVLFTLVLDSWLDLLGGNFLAEAFVISLAVGAVSLTISGLAARLGPLGIGVSAGIFLLLGVPLAGLALPHQALPTFWGDLGRFLPAGAGGELLRRVSFFPDASVGMPLLVLLGWLLFGLVLTFAGGEPYSKNDVGRVAGVVRILE